MASVIIIALAGLFYPFTGVLAVQAKLDTKEDVKDAIRHYATRYYIDPKIMSDVVECESGYKVTAFNGKDPNGGSYGVSQFQKGTFDWFTREMGIRDYDYRNPLHQLEVMAWAFDQGYASHWSCFKKLGYAQKHLAKI